MKVPASEKRHNNITCRVGVAVGVVLTALLHYANAQPGPAKASYEVASIKQRTDCGEGGVPARATPGGIYLQCAKVRALIATAYTPFGPSMLNARRPTVLGGPKWVDESWYDIVAKVQGSASTPDMIGPMLQSLLEDRFGLRIHKEIREVPVYALTLSGSRTKLRAAEEGKCVPLDADNLVRTGPRPPKGTLRFCGLGNEYPNGDHLVADWPSVTMAEFADRMLSGHCDRPVVDKTGLSGRFDIHLEFAPDTRPTAPQAKISG